MTGHAQEEAELGRGHAERARGPGKRPTVKWSKLGSDAESPPGKRSKVQVPGVKAANGKLSWHAKILACVDGASTPSAFSGVHVYVLRQVVPCVLDQNFNVLR